MIGRECIMILNTNIMNKQLQSRTKHPEHNTLNVNQLYLSKQYLSLVSQISHIRFHTELVIRQDATFPHGQP